MLTEAINPRMDAYSSAIRLCANTSLELRNFGSTDLPLGQTRTSVLYSRADFEDFFQQSHDFIAPSGSLRRAEKENFEPPEWDFEPPDAKIGSLYFSYI